MKRLRIVLAVLYLALAALVPYLHMPFHAHAEDVAAATSTCAHDHERGSRPPNTPLSEQDEDRDCSLCELIFLPSEIPDTYTPLKITFSPTKGGVHYPEHSDSPILRSHRARAPPVMTA